MTEGWIDDIWKRVGKHKLIDCVYDVSFLRFRKRKKHDLVGKWVSLNPKTGYVEEYTGKYPVFGMCVRQTMFRAWIRIPT